MFHDIGGAVEGAVLAELVAAWLAGYHDLDEVRNALPEQRPQTRAMRERKLSELLVKVRALVDRMVGSSLIE